jgi:hypothetical protein
MFRSLGAWDFRPGHTAGHKWERKGRRLPSSLFPDGLTWDKLSEALKRVIESAASEILNGTVRMVFLRESARFASVTAFDPKGAEMMRTHQASRASQE